MRFKERLARFFWGRYGVDELHRFLTWVYIVMMFGGAVVLLFIRDETAHFWAQIGWYVVTTAFLVYLLFRPLSKNIAARRRENEAFLRFRAKFRRKKIKKPADTADFVFRSCPKCKCTLRLPRQAGKHRVRCPKCHELFGVKIK